jgi:CBS domain-containing protein
MTMASRVFVARLAGTPVYDPIGDEVGNVRDVVATLPAGNHPPRVVGLVVEVVAWRRIFVPVTRVTSIAAGQVIVTGLVNVRRFQQRPTETLAIGGLLDKTVRLRETGEQVVVFDIGMEQARTGDWTFTKVAVFKGRRHRFRRRRQTEVVDWADVVGFAEEEESQDATRLLETLADLRPADLAGFLHDLSPKRRIEAAGALHDERLADVLEELPDADQVQILTALDITRAADVVSEMGPDDAADLLGQLPEATAERLLTLMTPKDADDVRRLLTYPGNTAGGLMTTEPVILPPDATVADALARLRIEELSPAMSAMAYVCRQPLEVPTGKYLGVVHIQRLLREPPSALVSAATDTELEALRPETSLEDVTGYLAAYNLVAAPVVDESGRLVGAVTVDDVLDHLLPADWRERHAEVTRGT